MSVSREVKKVQATRIIMNEITTLTTYPQFQRLPAFLENNKKNCLFLLHLFVLMCLRNISCPKWEYIWHKSKTLFRLFCTVSPSIWVRESGVNCSIVSSSGMGVFTAVCVSTVRTCMRIESGGSGGSSKAELDVSVPSHSGLSCSEESSSGRDWRLTGGAGTHGSATTRHSI